MIETNILNKSLVEARPCQLMVFTVACTVQLWLVLVRKKMLDSKTLTNGSLTLLSIGSRPI